MFEDDLRTQQHRAKLEKELRSVKQKLRSAHRRLFERERDLQEHEGSRALAKALQREIEYINKQIPEFEAREADIQTELAALPEPTETD